MRRPALRTLGLVAGLLAVFGCATTQTAQNPGGRMVAETTGRGEWHTWGGDAGFMRYSPLDQIDETNAAGLEVAWRWKALPLGSRPDTNYKATPLMIDGALYTPTGAHQVAAIDPATGETLWIYTPPPSDNPGRGLTLSSRSLAYWTDGKKKRLFHNTLDGRLLSIDAETGKADAAFGENGQIHLRKGLLYGGGDAPFVGSSSPPTVVGDIVIAQVVGEVTAANKEATPGHIRGYDVRTGRLVWTFHTIPYPGEFGNETWENESWRYSGNTGVWNMMSADPELGYVYLPVESPTHDFYGGHRLGDNLFGESIVALDARTGKRVWHFQIVHHGLWDYDLPAAPILHDIVVDGRRIRAVTVLTKQGMTFVFDRVTGKPVWPIEERPVPRIPVKGDRQSPTQPFPTRPEPFSKLGFHEDDLIDFTPELRREALAIVGDYVRGPMYTPTTPKENGKLGTIVYPGYGGGANWNGGAFDPGTGLLFTPTRNTMMVASLGEADPSLTNWTYTRPTTQTLAGPQGLPINRPPWSLVTATDMNRGEHVWRRAIGGAPDHVRNHPALKGLDLDFDAMGQIGVRPGPLVTKTLFFLAEAGNLSGDPGGPMFRAYDKRTGRVVAEIELPAKATGAPMTYMHKGRQYMVVAVSTQQHPAELVALALPGAASARTSAAGTAVAARPRTLILTASERETGARIFARACASCHGAGGEGRAGEAPRVSHLADLAEITRFVRQGGVEMPAMAALLTSGEIEAVSRYVAGGGLEPAR